MKLPCHLIALFLTLNFDGSFKPPPSNLKKRRNGNVDTHYVPIASCGASIVKDDGTVLVGGRMLPISSPSLTSAQAEYEGLLLGLRHISKLNTNNCHSGNDLIIRGDCKTVIEQLKGNAVPRKLLPEYQLAEKLIQDLQMTVKLELIPREENKLADLICRRGMGIVQQKAIDTLGDLCGKAESRTIAESEKKMYFVEALQFLLNSETGSTIPWKFRSTFLRRLANAAHGGTELERVAMEIREESKRPYYTSKEERKQLDLEGVRFQIEAMKLMMRYREAGILEKRYRYPLLSMESSALEESSCHIDYLGTLSMEHKEWNCLLSSWEDLVQDTLPASRREGRGIAGGLFDASGIWTEHDIKTSANE